MGGLELDQKPYEDQIKVLVIQKVCRLAAIECFLRCGQPSDQPFSWAADVGAPMQLMTLDLINQTLQLVLGTLQVHGGKHASPPSHTVKASEGP